MAIERNPNDRPSDLYADPELGRTPPYTDIDPVADDVDPPGSAGRIAAVAVAIALAFGAIYYGMNATSTGPNQPAVATSQNAPSSTSAQNLPPVRDVTPNRGPGMTTGSAPTRPSDSTVTTAPMTSDPAPDKTAIAPAK